MVWRGRDLGGGGGLGESSFEGGTKWIPGESRAKKGFLAVD